MGLLLGLASPNTPVPNSDQEVTIGSGWTVERNFNAGVDGTSAYPKINPSATGIGFDATAGESYFTNDEAYEGGLSVECNITEGRTAFGDWGGKFEFPERLGEGDSLWLRTRNRYPTGFDFSCGGCTEGMKFTRIHVGNSSLPDKNVGYLHTFIKGGTTDGNIIASSEVGGSAFGENNFDSGDWSRFDLGETVTRNNWMTFEHQVTLRSGSGVYRLWQNGKLIFEDLKTRTLATSDDYSDFIYIYTYWNNGAPRTQKCYIDDVVITTKTPSDTDSHGNPYIGMS